MSLTEIIKGRRSIKQYDPEHVLSDGEIRALLNAACLAPTSFNMQNRHFVVVTDPAVKEALLPAAWGQAQVRDASVVFVLAGDLTAHRNFDRYLRHAPPPVREMFEPMISDFYEGKAELLRDEACRSVGLAAMNLMLMAQDMGYGSCPMIGFDPAQVSEIIGLDADHPPLMLVTVGKGVKEAWGRLGPLDFEEQVSVDRFGNHGITGPIDG